MYTKCYRHSWIFFIRLIFYIRFFFIILNEPRFFKVLRRLSQFIVENLKNYLILILVIETDNFKNMSYFFWVIKKISGTIKVGQGLHKNHFFSYSYKCTLYILKVMYVTKRNFIKNSLQIRLFASQFEL